MEIRIDEIYVVYKAPGIGGDTGWMHVLGINTERDILYHEVIREPHQGKPRYSDTPASFHFKKTNPGITERLTGKPPKPKLGAKEFKVTGRDRRLLTIDFFEDVKRYQEHNMSGLQKEIEYVSTRSQDVVRLFSEDVRSHYNAEQSREQGLLGR